MKTNKPDGEKVFLNVCSAEQVCMHCTDCNTKIPSPPSVSDDQLTEALLTMNPAAYKVPMSVGPGHAEVDNSAF